LSTFAICVLTSRTQAAPEQQAFLRGKPATPAPEGLYAGEVPGRTLPWKGKRFEPSTATGDNVFEEDSGARAQKYPFKTYVAKGIRDPTLEVFKIDYDIPGNPFWLRRILDEVVQVGPDEYLGKIHVRWLFGSSFALGYFKLKKAG